MSEFTHAEAPVSRDNEVFCEIRWVREDVKTKLEELDIPATEENIDKAIDACQATLQDLSIAKGWEIIEELIPEDLYAEQEQESEQDGLPLAGGVKDKYLEAVIENAPTPPELPSCIDYDSFIVNAAYYLQRNIEKFDMDWGDAINTAISRSLRDREKIDFELFNIGINGLSNSVDAALGSSSKVEPQEDFRGDVAHDEVGRE